MRSADSKKTTRAVHLTTILGIGLIVFSVGALSGCGGQANPNTHALATSASSESWDFGGVQGIKLTTAHYVIYTTSADRRLTTRLPDFMEKANRQYLQLTGLGEAPLPQRMPMYVLGSRQQWAAMTQRVTGPQAPVYLTIQNGGYCYEGTCVFWDLGFFGTYGIAAHEGLHQFLSYRLKDHIPAWTEEGLSCLAEAFQVQDHMAPLDPAANTLRQADLRRELADSRWIPLSVLLSGDAADFTGARSADYYAQLWALLMYIRSQDAARAGLERMIADAAAGKLRGNLHVPEQIGAGRGFVRLISQPAFEKYIDPDVKRFEFQYRLYARKLAKL